MLDFYRQQKCASLHGAYFIGVQNRAMGCRHASLDT